MGSVDGLDVLGNGGMVDTVAQKGLMGDTCLPDLKVVSGMRKPSRSAKPRLA